MQIKEIKPMTLLCFRTQTTLPQMMQYVGAVPKKLYEEANRLGLHVTGPNYWLYQGMDGNPDTVFTLDIALPVAEAKGESNGYFFRQTDSFRCLAETHTDAWEKMPETYGKLMQEIGVKNLTVSGECREIYITVDFTIPENNSTEVQIGIQ